MRAFRHLVDNVLQAAFEFALHAGTGLQQAHVERVDVRALQHLGHVAGGDAQGQAFHHGRLAHARLTGEYRIVLAPAQQDVDGLAYLALAADHGIELAVARQLRQVGGELVQRRGLAGQSRKRIVGCLGKLRHGRAFLPGAGRQLVRMVLQLLHAEAGEQLRAAVGELRQFRLRQQRQQQMAAADGSRLRRIERGDQPGVLEQQRQMGREDGRARTARAEAADLAAQVRLQRRQADFAAPRDGDEIAALLFQQRQEQVFDIDFILPQSHADAGGAGGSRARRVIQLGDQGFQMIAHAAAPLRLIE